MLPVLRNLTNHRQPGEGGLAVLMVSAVVALKHETSTKATFMNQLIWNLDWVITSRVSTTLPSLVKIVSAVAPPRGGEIYGSRAFFIIIFVFIFLDTHTAYTREPILTYNSSKHANWLKEIPFKQVFFDISLSWVIFPQNPQYFTVIREITRKEKMSNNFKPVRVRTKVT